MNNNHAQVILECIQLYRDFPYLWDNRQILYNNKEARDKAYEVILEKYRQIHEDVTIPELKKKLENLRTTFRREHKKVLRSRLRGDDPEYKPQLFYYEPMTFLNEVTDYGNIEVDDLSRSIKNEYDEATPRKIRAKKRNVSSVYLPEHETEEDDDDVDDHSEVVLENPETDVNDNSRTTYGASASECQAFGTTVGLQLKDMDHMQRVFAEKLISDVIFNGRLHRLSISSSVQI